MDLTIHHQAVLTSRLLNLGDLRRMVEKTQGWNGSALVIVDGTHDSQGALDRLTVTLGGPE